MPIKYVDGKKVHLPYPKKRKRTRKSPSKAIRKLRKRTKRKSTLYSEWLKKQSQKQKG